MKSIFVVLRKINQSITQIQNWRMREIPYLKVPLLEILLGKEQERLFEALICFLDKIAVNHCL